MGCKNLLHGCTDHRTVERQLRLPSCGTCPSQDNLIAPTGGHSCDSCGCRGCGTCPINNAGCRSRSNAVPNKTKISVLSKVIRELAQQGTITCDIWLKHAKVRIDHDNTRHQCRRRGEQAKGAGRRSRALQHHLPAPNVSSSTHPAPHVSSSTHANGVTTSE